MLGSSKGRIGLQVLEPAVFGARVLLKIQSLKGGPSGLFILSCSVSKISRQAKCLCMFPPRRILKILHDAKYLPRAPKGSKN